MISSQESITSRVQNQLLLSQTPELFDEPIRGGDYDTSLNYRVEDEHQFGESSTAGMVPLPLPLSFRFNSAFSCTSNSLYEVTCPKVIRRSRNSSFTLLSCRLNSSILPANMLRKLTES